MLGLSEYLRARRVVRRDRLGLKLEPELFYLPGLIPDGGVCLHVGASDGRHAFAMARSAADVRIFAVEPARFSYGVLVNAIRMHGLQNQVFPTRAAMSDRPGELTLVTPLQDGWRPRRSFAFVAPEAIRACSRPDRDPREKAKAERVSVITIDDFCEGFERLDFLRMDIEGAEMDALRGGYQTIDRYRPHALVEIHPRMLKTRFFSSADDVMRFFVRSGYLMFALDEDGQIERRSTIVPGPWKDYFFLHPCRPFPQVFAAACERMAA